MAHLQSARKVMNILYINGWSIDDPLTVATTFPSLRALSSSTNVKQVIFATPERVPIEGTCISNKIHHIGIPLRERSSGWGSYFLREIELFRRLLEICKVCEIHLIIARGAPSGGRASWLSLLCKVPFMVESYEPHSQYMLDSKVWTLCDPRYLLQKLWEYCIQRRATALMTVSNNFAVSLRAGGVESNRVFVIPCTVDIRQFEYSIEDRSRVRRELGIPPQATVGIYVGKFGGIYFELFDAIRVFSEAFREIEDFRLIILSTDSREVIYNAVYNSIEFVDTDRLFILNASHPSVPSYLSAADFGYALIKTGPSKKFCSPVKVGEYWANGLPVIIPKDIGDDSRIIEESGLGVVIDDAEGWCYCERILSVLSRRNHRYNISELARKNRSAELIPKVYRELGF